ncbi:MAG TPA: neocarzinostatin apoprotein domain-containing protein [Polyangiaceae bacterium]|nr:neocarzinostatin apoprotein domain-containing protein [Polyangiaceae bacterium]
MSRSWCCVLACVWVWGCGDGESPGTQSSDLKPPPSGPRLTVAPNTDLLDGQAVQVTASGFAPNSELLLAQCFGSFPGECTGTQRSLTDATGSFQGAMNVARFFDWPSRGRTLSCAAPGSCVIGVLVGTRTVQVPLTFRDIPIAKGTIRIESPVNAGELITITGSGWTPGGRVHLGFGALAASINEPGDGADALVDASGEIRGGVPATYLRTISDYENAEVDLTLVDCTTSPAACGVTAFDTRDPAATFVRVAAMVRAAQVPRGTAALDLATPLVHGLVTRVVGSGWTGSDTLQAWACKDSSLVGCQQLAPFRFPGIRVDESGNLRAYQSLLGYLHEGDAAVVDCHQQASCTLLLADPRALEATRVHVPLTFVQGDQFEVTSHYSASEEAWFQEGLQLTGSTESEFQTTSALRTLYMLALAGASSGGQRPREGAYSHTSTYTYFDYATLSAEAARFDYTLDEIQKVGSLFWSWFIQGLPQPGP